ncbi:unnamed protein product [Clonostachys rhizophaga]|uniref:Uncharacterized protein n=1 Tax=Clonostachys rhizophaga TaxID=160324 RepID=A0A9N9VMU8_9HYPO|nr:unnamed protein product [Clonostachys rhizophaga]
MASLNFIYQPSIVERGANFRKPPIIIKFENFPAGYSYFSAKICLKDENNEEYVNGSLGGHTIASPIFDEANTCYFKIRHTNITQKGKFRIEVQVFGIPANPDHGQTYITHNCSSPIKVISRDPEVRLSNQERAFITYIKSLE